MTRWMWWRKPWWKPWRIVWYEGDTPLRTKTKLWSKHNADWECARLNHRASRDGWPDAFHHRVIDLRDPQ